MSDTGSAGLAKRVRGRRPARARLWRAVVALCAAWAVASASVGPAAAQDPPDDEPSETCDGDEDTPTPTAVAVTSVPISVTSTTADYFVLYVRFGAGDTASDLPVAVVPGQAGTTTLAENVEALPAERYRVDKYSVADPADVDGDCVDDLTELASPATMSPVNSAVPEFSDGTALSSADGAVNIPDRAAFETLAQYRNDMHTVKFVVLGMETDEPSLYFMNTNSHQSHYPFSQSVDSQSRTRLNATLVHDSSLTAPDGGTGAYYFFRNAFTEFDVVARLYAMLAANAAFLDDDLVFFIPNGLLPDFQDDLPSLRESRIDLVFTEDLYAGADFISLHRGSGYGYLRQMDPDERPGPRDIVLYDTLPNELPRVAGIISTVPQTPLSHVNLRAIQDDVPNAFIRDILGFADIAALVDRPIAYTVTSTTWNVRAATVEEVDAHHASLRPSTSQTPQRDLSVTTITPLCRVGFGGWTAFGVKAANVAVLGNLGFGDGVVPDGFAVPFYFYDEFMKANDLYTQIDTMFAVENFYTDLDVQEAELKKLRDAIKSADTPEWITDALSSMHNAFPSGTSLRYRSSTNNEDLPGFNGAGLYDSKTQHADETPLSKSLRQVYASLWNFRAFTEREFYRIDHKAAAMGVLVHPNYSDELANGVAVSFDPFDRTNPEYGDGPYYVNTQVGEDLVTNPEAHSVPEEILLNAYGGYTIFALSNQVARGELLLSDAQLLQLRGHLETIHDRFEQLHGPAAGDPFAMEIEFKITSDNILAIKQARPWVFPDAASTSPQTTTEAPAECASSRLSALGPVSPTQTPTSPTQTPTSPTQTPTSPTQSSRAPTSGGGGGGGAVPEPAEEPPAQDEPDTFEDIADTGVHQPALQALAADGVLDGTGCGDGLLCPGDAIPRWEIAVWLVRVVDGDDPEPATGGTRFTDVDPDAWWAAHVDRLAELEITTGCRTQPLSYCPQEPVKRSQMASFLARAFDLEESSPAGFVDIAGSVHEANINALHAAGITVGCRTDPLEYCPSRHTTRAHMATFLHRAINVQSSLN